MAGLPLHNFRKDGDAFAQKVGIAAIIEEDVILNALITSGATLAVDSRTNTGVSSGTGKFNGATKLYLLAQVDGANYSAGDTLTFKFYRDKDSQVGASVSVVVPSVNDGYAQMIEISDPNEYINMSEYYKVTGTISNTASATLKLVIVKIGGTSSSLATNDDGEMISASYDEISGADKIIDLAPDALVKLPLKLLVNVTNEAAATYRTIINFKGYDNATINVICAGGITADLFGTNNDSADDTADTGWVSLSASSIVDTTDGWVINGQEPWDRLMIKRVASDASNSTVIDVNLGG